MHKRILSAVAMLYLVCPQARAADDLIPSSPVIDVSYYRVRIELTTTSDWTRLAPSDSSSILAVGPAEPIGTPTKAEVRGSRASVTQLVDDARAGESAGVVFEYYLKPPKGSGQRFAFQVEKGGLNETTVRVLNMVGFQPRFVHEETIRGQHDSATSAYEFSFDLRKLRQVPPSEAKIRIAPRKLLWAFYYPWYGAKDWSSDRLRDRPAEKYASNDREAVERHIDQAQKAGIDGFICSWWGPDDYTDKNLKLILDVAKEKRFLVTIYFETLTGGRARTRETIQTWLEYVIRSYGSHPAFMKINGKPLIVIWSSTKVPREKWKTIFWRLKNGELEGCFLAHSYDLADLEAFDGLHQYGTGMPGSARAEFLSAVARRTRHWVLPDDPPGPKICAASVMPGYDDRLIPGRGGLEVDRKGGDYYRAAFDRAIKMDPDWIFITTWNEWWEHTYIEPSELYGDKYLNITRECAQKWKGK